MGPNRGPGVQLYSGQSLRRRAPGRAGVLEVGRAGQGGEGRGRARWVGWGGAWRGLDWQAGGGGTHVDEVVPVADKQVAQDARLVEVP